MVSVKGVKYGIRWGCRRIITIEPLTFPWPSKGCIGAVEELFVGGEDAVRCGEGHDELGVLFHSVNLHLLLAGGRGRGRGSQGWVGMG